jgi:hypothetical protein
MFAHKKQRQLCCEYSCSAVRWNYGRCGPHALALPEAERKRLKSIAAKDRHKEYFKRVNPPERPKWEWAGDEAELAAIFGGNDNR